MPPQRGRVGLEPGPGQVDGDGLRRVVVLALGGDDPQLVVVADDDRVPSPLTRNQSSPPVAP